MMDPFIKAAVAVGQRKALYETTEKLRGALKDRLTKVKTQMPDAIGDVGWKERPLGKPKA